MSISNKIIENIDDLLLEDVDSSHKEKALKEETDSRNLSRVHLGAIREYTGIGHADINNSLRGHPMENPDIDRSETIKDLKKVTNHPTKHKLYVYRGIDHKTTDKFKKGDIIHDKGFVSTSLKKAATQLYGTEEDGGTTFRIHIHPGTKGAYVGRHSRHSQEKEFLLHPGTKFKVGNTREDEDGRRIVNLHIHSQPGVKRKIK